MRRLATAYFWLVPLLFTVAVSAYSQNPCISIDPAVSTDAGPVRTGGSFSTTLAMTNIIVNNTTNCTARVNLVLAVGTDFALQSPLAEVVLAPGDKQTIRVSFQPLDTCARYDTILVRHDGSGTNPFRIPIKGTGVLASYAIDPTNKMLDLGGSVIGKPISSQFRILNKAGSGLCLDSTAIFTLRIAGPNAGEFSTPIVITSSTHTRVSPDGAIVVPITATPAAAGIRTAYALITSEIYPNIPDTVFLAVTGLDPKLSSVKPAVDFALTNVGGTRDSTLKAFIQNNGNTDASFTSDTIVGPDATSFRLLSPTNAHTIKSGAFDTLLIRFNPQHAGSLQASLLLNYMNGGQPQQLVVTLRGLSELGAGGILQNLILVPQTALNQCTDTLIKRVIYNSGNVSLVISAARMLPDPAGKIADTADFSVVAPPLPITIAPGDSSGITIRFCPKVAGAHQAKLSLTANTSSGTLEVALLGVGASSQIIDVDTVQFAPVRVLLSRDTVLNAFIHNRQPGAITIDSVSIAGADAQAFSVVSPTLPLQIAANSTSPLTIRFRPQRRGANTAFLYVYSQQGKRGLTLTGSGIYPFLEIRPHDPASFRVRVGTTRRIQVDVINNGDDTAHIAQITVSGDPAFTNAALGLLPRVLRVGDTIALQVDFSPKRLCDHIGKINLQGEGIRGIYTLADTAVSFTGIGVGPHVSSRQPQISFGTKLPNSITDSVLNDFLGNVDFTGANSSCIEDSQIDSLVISGPNASSFAIMVPANPAAQRPLSSGDRIPLTIRFNPLTSGLHRATLLAYFDGNRDSVTSIELIGASSALPIEYGPAPNQIEVNFGAVQQGQWRDSTFTATNISNAPLTLDSIFASSSGDFQILAPTSFPITLQPGVPLTITGRFSPLLPLGMKNGVAVLKSGALADSSFGLAGKAVANILRITPTTVDFGAHLPGVVVDSSIALLNTVTVLVNDPALIQDAKIANVAVISGGTWFSVTGFPQVVLGNTTDTVHLRFTSALPTGKQDGLIRIYYNPWNKSGVPAQDSLDIGVTAFVIGGEQMEISLGPDQTGKPGDILRYPIILQNTGSGAAPDTLQMRIAFGNTVLRPQKIVPAQTGVTGFPLSPAYTLGRTGYYTFELNGTSPFTTGTVAYVEFSALLPDTLSTSVSLDSILVPNHPEITFAADTALFSLSGYCDPLNRQVYFGAAPLLKVIPSQSNSAVRIHYGVPVAEHVAVALYAQSGQVVSTIVNGEQAAGEYDLTINLSNLANGDYYIRLVAGRFSSVGTVHVVK